ncbi:MAG: hypothetical protein DDT18_01792 [Actinobacteria bacterium]|nr:hypothetical protein [Actinomycetota bacterium]
MAELTPTQKQVIDLFKKSPLKNQFYWTGGTLLAVLYLHHRQSKDLDFFSNTRFSSEQLIGFINQIKKTLKISKIEQKKIFDRYEFFLDNKDELRIEFVFYEHPKLKPRKKWQGIWVDSLEDIAANKTMAFFDRNDPKDLCDIYFLLTKKKFDVKQLLKLVEKKFGLSFSESMFWSEGYKAFKELDNLKPLLLVKTPKERKQIIEEIKNYFTHHSTQYLHRIIK